MNMETLLRSPRELDFYQAVYLLQKMHGGAGSDHEVGHDSLPANELIRFKVPQHLGFPGTPVEDLQIQKNSAGELQHIDMFVTFMGLTGPSGVLPRHYSELVLQRLKDKDSGMQEFFDLFNHRLISLYYRAWEKFRFPIQYQKHLSNKSDPLSNVLTSLTGARQDLEIHFGGLLAKQNRSARALKQILQAISGCEVKIKEMVGRWLQLAEEEQTRLGTRDDPEGQHARLGCSATLGGQVWDVNSGIDVEFQITSSGDAEKLMPGGPVLGLLQSLMDSYMPPSTKVRWRMRACYRDLPMASLSRQGPGLGQGGALMMRSTRLGEETLITMAS